MGGGEDIITGVHMYATKGPYYEDILSVYESLVSNVNNVGGRQLLQVYIYY